MKKVILFLLTAFCIFAAKDVLSQTSTRVNFNEEFTGDTIWSVNNFNFSLDVDWIGYEDYQYLLFGGTFKTSFEQFNKDVDSISLDIKNSCSGCFDLILHKSGENPVYIETPSGSSQVSIDNPWNENPDSLTMWTMEGGIKYIEIYHQMPDTLCPSGDVTFFTQEEIDSFQTDYPNCNEIDSDIEINGTDITNLSGLSNITSIGGDLWIHSNSQLQSLSGLENVSSIEGKLWIIDNDAITNLIGLDNLSSVEGDLVISQNDNLQNLVGLGSLTSISQSLIIGGYEFGNEYDGIDNLGSLSGINNLESIGADFVIQWNSSLVNFSGLENLLTIGGNFQLEECYALENFTGLEGLISIGGEMYLQENFALKSLSGLENLNVISNGLSIKATTLEDINSLSNLNTIDGELMIRYNSFLSDLSGLDNINANSISNLSIYNNDSLSNCEVKSICDYLASPNGTVRIENNKEGCNSQEEVEWACETASVNEIFDSESDFIIYPNPANNEIWISHPEKEDIVGISIYNQMGQLTLEKEPTTNPINISMLKKGMYLIEITTNKRKIRNKFLKNK